MRSTTRIALLIAGLVALAFGALTILSGGRALFGGAAARAAVGDAVPFVLWFNFIAGFAYIIAGVGLILRRAWSAWLAAAILAATLLVLAAFGLHVLQGGAYENSHDRRDAAADRCLGRHRDRRDRRSATYQTQMTCGFHCCDSVDRRPFRVIVGPVERPIPQIPAYYS